MGGAFLQQPLYLLIYILCSEAEFLVEYLVGVVLLPERLPFLLNLREIIFHIFYELFFYLVYLVLYRYLFLAHPLRFGGGLKVV